MTNTLKFVTIPTNIYNPSERDRVKRADAPAMIVKQIPNLLSLIRLFLIAPFLITFHQGDYASSFYIFLIAGITDGIDGWLARHFHWQTKLGQLIDPIADKLLVACSFISLAMIHVLPWWLVILVFMRDLTLFMGAAAWYSFIERSYEFKPTLLSKINTALQILLVTCCLLNIAFQPGHAGMLSTTIWFLIRITALTTTITYIDYVWTWGKKACLAKKH